ncbi:MAG: peptidase [Cyclobacteriaceae bacterium]|nr:peptidase [Cyclobacteriaceae bacterium]
MNTLGRADRVDLPGLKLEDIQAKIDTGAYTSSLHCLRAEVVDGKLEFVLLDEEHPEFTGMKFVFKKFDQREIKNSFGEAELRYVIKTKVKIFDSVIRAEFSLSNRGNLKFPVLLGRKILRHRFIIDVTKKDLSFNYKQAISQGPSQKEEL